MQEDGNEIDIGFLMWDERSGKRGWLLPDWKSYDMSSGLQIPNSRKTGTAAGSSDPRPLKGRMELGSVRNTLKG